jgi:hypothetical protein
MKIKSGNGVLIPMIQEFSLREELHAVVDLFNIVLTHKKVTVVIEI